ncbi:MAG: acylphosphatase [Armatimonadaceae bacterium]
MSDTATAVYRLHATVRGRVQGVGFRYWTHHTAQNLHGVSGFVRNMPDGSVQVEAECVERERLEALLNDLHHGPSTSHVETVDYHWEECVSGRYHDFRVA